MKIFNTTQIKLIIMLCLVSSIGRFVIDSYLPSLPAIATGLGLTANQAELTMTLYLLGFGLSQPFYGPLADRFGRRKILLSGLFIFLCGSLGCMLANSAESLLISRLLAGIGAGACGTLNRAIATDVFEGTHFSKAWSYTTTALVLTLILAPLLGGWLQSFGSWRWNFLASLLFVGVIFIVIYYGLPETSTPAQRSNFRFKQILANYKTIITSRNFLIPVIIYTLTFSGLIGYFQISALLFIDHYGLSVGQYGLSSLGIALSYLMGGKLVRAYVDYLGVKLLLHIGIVCLVIGGLLMLFAATLFTSHWQYVLIAAMIYTLGARLIIPNTTSLAMQSFRHIAGSASALLGCIQMVGSMLISGMLALFSTESAIPLGSVMFGIGVVALMIGLINYKYYWLRLLITTRNRVFV